MVSSSGIRIIITSSHRPTRAIRTLLKDLASVLPRSKRVNRGKMSHEDRDSLLDELGAEYALIVERWHGMPGSLRFYKAEGRELVPIPPRIFIKGVKFRREFKGSQAVALKATAISTPKEPSTLRLAEGLGRILGLPLTETPTSVYLELRVGEREAFVMSFKAGESRVDVGPTIFVKLVAWGSGFDTLSFSDP